VNVRRLYGHRKRNGKCDVDGKRVLLIIGGGIAAYKCLDLVRRLRERGVRVRVVLTEAGTRFVTPLSLSALTNDRVFGDLFSLDDEREIGHIRLSREADLLVVAPATADLLAKMAGGHADDLATAVLLATDKPVLAAPAMNPRMWLHPATQRNVAQLEADGVTFVPPGIGEMAERGEAGPGRLAEVPDLVSAIEAALAGAANVGAEGSGPRHSLAGRRIVVTSGPTHEPIDPVRYIANRSSGKQGHAIAAAAAALGADVMLISGPVNLPDPPGVSIVRIETADELLAAVQAAMPADVGIFAAAVADWRVANASGQKIKKGASGSSVPTLELVENPDVLRTIARDRKVRPSLVVGFAAETQDVIANAQKKRKSKACDWIVANDVSPDTGIMGGDRNTVHLVTGEGVESWPDLAKEEVAQRLLLRVAEELARSEP